MNCTMHPEVDAAGTCTYCGKPFCKECLVEVDGKMVCRADVTKLVSEAKSAAAAATQPINVNVSNVNTSANSNVNNNRNMPGGMAYPHKSKWVAFFLCLFVGVFGIHRFYVGKIGTGILYLFTLGFGGFGCLVDLIVILVGGFRDKANMPLV